MTISGAMSNALSGLNAAARLTDIVSGNLANVLTEGYAPRDLALVGQRDGGGVRVAGVTRQVDTALMADRRLADSTLAAAETRDATAAALERAVGTPDEGGSLSALVARFQASLISAASRPEESNRLEAVLRAASDLGRGLNDASGAIATLRQRSDADISHAVDSVNTALEEVATLNGQILRARSVGHETAALEDQRQSVIDRLSEFLPVRELPRDHGAVALVTTGGALLLDGRPARLEFTPAGVIAPHMTVANGLLSGIRIDGRDVPVGTAAGPLSGGRLAALFEARDATAPAAQENLDALARDLIERYEAPGLDPSLGGPGPGLFTDAGALLDPTNVVGIAGRISVNAAVDPARGGAVYRLRDGLGASGPGAVGDATLLQAFADALAAPRILASGGLGGTARDASGHVASLVSALGQIRLSADQARGFASGQAAELRSLALADGVDSDAELQRLLIIEQAFGANARVIQTVDDMMQTLLRI